LKAWHRRTLLLSPPRTHQQHQQQQNVGPGGTSHEVPVHLLGEVGPVPDPALLQEPVDLALLLHRVRRVHSAVLQIHKL
uniref:Uncharacterized protein n=1 Tax=Anopheles coluzzii TaxID=1518534 RepID=A0A8W7PP47_ANOCL